MDVRVDAAGRDDLTLAGHDIGAAADHHARGDAVHDVRAAGLADADNEPVLDANVGLVDARPVDYEGVCDDDVERVGVAAARGLPHALAQRLAAAKLALVAVGRQVALDADPEVRVGQAHQVARRGTKHGGVGGAFHAKDINVRRVAPGLLGSVGEAGGDEAGENVVEAPGLDGARRETVAAADDARAANLYQRHRLGVAGLEAHRCAGGDVEPEAVGARAIKLELWVRLDEVVM